MTRKLPATINREKGLMNAANITEALEIWNKEKYKYSLKFIDYIINNHTLVPIRLLAKRDKAIIRENFWNKVNNANRKRRYND